MGAPRSPLVDFRTWRAREDVNVHQDRSLLGGEAEAEALVGAGLVRCLSWAVGDIDNSGELNVIDLLLLGDMINDLGIGICSESISDINGDGEISQVDIQFLINILMLFL